MEHTGLDWDKRVPRSSIYGTLSGEPGLNWDKRVARSSIYGTLSGEPGLDWDKRVARSSIYGTRSGEPLKIQMGAPPGTIAMSSRGVHPFEFSGVHQSGYHIYYFA